ncbi:MAG: DNA repair protein RecN [Actinomycetota bacterium]|nr:DNA repair protein RecN [Actinomycetota bacterium]
MLAELTVKDFALIDELALSLKEGLNIITGETGAGKSIIIESINLLVGGRADTSRVRRGADAADITGLFIMDDGREVALRRVLSRDGRSRAFINGRPATTGQLCEIGDALLDIHGQHEHQVLLNVQRHLELIDRFGGEGIRAAKEAYQALRADYRRKLKEIAGLRAAEAAWRDRLDLLTWQIKELSGAKLTLGEDEELEIKVNRMKGYARIFEAVGKARRAIDDTAIDAAQTALAEISRVADADDELGTVTGLLEAAAANLEEAGRALRDYCQEPDFNEGRLEAHQERLFALSDLKKKYGLSLQGLVDYLAAAQVELAGIAGSDAVAEESARQVERLSREVSAAADALSLVRGEAGGRFAGLVRSQLQDLAMAGAEFSVKFIRRDGGDWHEQGAESAEFLFSANTGEPPRPLARIASGGELSRVMLAMRTVFGAADATPTLVFDEIDAGIGGKTAVKVGERLSALGRRHQVVCVTHLAQIAAFADHHLAVVKTETGGNTSMRVEPVAGADRLKELSRLGGALNESEISVKHARQLLSQAEAKKSVVAQ